MLFSSNLLQNILKLLAQQTLDPVQSLNMRIRRSTYLKRKVNALIDLKSMLNGCYTSAYTKILGDGISKILES